MNFKRGKNPKEALDIGLKGISVYSDGTPAGTKIYHNGERIEGVRKVSIEIEVNQITKILLDIVDVPGLEPNKYKGSRFYLKELLYKVIKK